MRFSKVQRARIRFLTTGHVIMNAKYVYHVPESTVKPFKKDMNDRVNTKEEKKILWILFLSF